jgi:hypothetical protein
MWMTDVHPDRQKKAHNPDTPALPDRAAFFFAYEWVERPAYLAQATLPETTAPRAQPTARSTFQ